VSPLALNTSANAPGPQFHRGAGVVLHADHRVLLAHRTTSREWGPATWDIPGGHVLDGELEIETGIREVWEELGVSVTGDDLYELARLAGTNFEVAYFVTTSWRGSPYNAAPDEHSEVGWFGLEQLGILTLSDPAIFPILRAALDYDHRQQPS
jgi:8-oxo-dGTP diphosphatase